ASRTRKLHVAAVLGRAGFARQRGCLQAVSGTLFAGPARQRALYAAGERAAAQRDAMAGLQPGSTQRYASSGMAGAGLSGRLPGEYGGPDAGQVHAPRRRARRTPRIGSFAAHAVRATAAGVGCGRLCRRRTWAFVGVARLVACTPATV